MLKKRLAASKLDMGLRLDRKTSDRQQRELTLVRRRLRLRIAFQAVMQGTVMWDFALMRANDRGVKKIVFDHTLVYFSKHS